jgi:dolichol kinase
MIMVLNDLLIKDLLSSSAFINSFALVFLNARKQHTILISLASISLYSISSPPSEYTYTLSMLSAMVLFRALLYNLPKNFTIGEAMIISNIISILLGDAVRCSLGASVMPPIESPFRFFLLSLILGMILIGVAAYYPILLPLRSFCTDDKQSERSAAQRIRYSLAFHTCAIGFILLFISPWTRMFLEHNAEPFNWVFDYIFNNASQERPALFFIWLIVIIFGLILASQLFKTPAQSPLSLNNRRKYYHAMAVAIFLPGYILDVRLCIF